MADAKTNQVQVYLLKDTAVEFVDVLRSQTHPLLAHELRNTLDFEGVVYTAQSHIDSPRWADFVRTGVADPLDELLSATASALVLLRASGRIFAVTFGHSKSFIDQELIVRDFGLKVVLNTVDPDHIRAVDARAVEEMTFHTRRQASRTTAFQSFRLDTNHELLRGVTGKPADPNLGSRVSGSESVTVEAEVTFQTLSDKCSQLLEAYGRTDYRARFSFVDHLSLVKDPVLVEVLNQQLDKDLAAGNTESMHLAPPEVLDWENVSGFYYSERDGAPRFRELDIDEAVGAIPHRGDISVGHLRRTHVWVEFRTTTQVPRYTAYSCLVYEVDHDGALYVLSDGDWHQVEKAWADTIRNAVATIPDGGFDLPDALAGEIESAYNARVAAALDAALLDAKTLVLDGPGDKIEACDLLTPAGQLVHVKRKAQSSTLSHLFNQGLNSAQLLLYDRRFREKARERLGEVKPELLDLIPVGRPDPSKYQIAYVIIAKSSRAGRRQLPFFSQLSLANTNRTLTQLGYPVSLTRVSVQAP